MARKKRILTEEKIQALIQNGRVQGEGANHIPWIQIGDFFFQGRSHRIQDHRTGRIHHLFSDLEADYYYILAWADSVEDIREQYPLLPVSEKERIADVGIVNANLILQFFAGKKCRKTAVRECRKIRLVPAQRGY